MAACVALVVAAGQGVRLGGDVPKQYRMLDGQPVLRRTLRALLDHPAIDAVRPVIDPTHRSLFDAAADGLAVLEPVVGGATRQESVRLGLESLVERHPARVLIHDAARPFVDRDLIARVLGALDRVPGAVPAVAVSDTIKRARADGAADEPIRGLIETTVSRDRLWRVQTPQGFRFDAILDAHRRAAGADLTDDAAVAENAGLAVAIVAGSAGNLKLTTPEDWRQAERLLSSRDVRTGMGFDVHRFGPGDHVMLCGVRIPFAAGLEGHSDADVGLHALTDAILGAIGAGDIGEHFPPSDPRWRGAPSDIFLRRAGELVTAAGGRIANVDVTIICERPRIGPHRAAMIARVAEILGLARERVAVKATTTERLGFTGREEGIAAQAIATVALPAAEG